MGDLAHAYIVADIALEPQKTDNDKQVLYQGVGMLCGAYDALSGATCTVELDPAIKQHQHADRSVPGLVIQWPPEYAATEAQKQVLIQLYRALTNSHVFPRSNLTTIKSLDCAGLVTYNHIKGSSNIRCTLTFAGENVARDLAES